MAPSKVDVERSKREEKGEGEDRGVLGLTSSMTNLTLHSDTSKDLAKLEADLAKVTLEDSHKQDEDLRRQDDEEEEEEEEEETKKRDTESRKEEEEEEGERDSAEEIDVKKTESVSRESEKLPESKAHQEKQKKEDAEEEEEIEKKEEEKEECVKEKGEEIEEEEEEEEEAVKVTLKEGKQDEEEEEEEESVSDDENPPERDEKVEPKDRRLRSRGHGRGSGHGYTPSTQLGYQAFQQQQQQQPPSLGSFYPGLASPQYGQVAGYPGTSPTHMGQVGESPQGLWACYGGSDSPQHQYQDVSSSYYPSPEYQGSTYSQYQGSPSSQYQASPSSQYQASPNSQYQASPSSQYQASPNSQYQASPSSQYQASPSSQYQASPSSQYQTSPSSQYQTPPSSQYQASPSSQYQASPRSLFQASPSSQYQASPSSQYQASSSSQYQASPSSQYQASPSSQYQASPSSQYQPSSPFYPDDSLFQNMNSAPSECQEGAYQECLIPSTDTTTTTTQQFPHFSPMTPPYSPPLTEQPTGEDVLEVLDYFVDVKKCSCEILQDHSDSRIHKDESKIIEIARMLMDISNCSNLEEQLDQEKYIQFYRWCSAMDNEDLVAEDEDGDIKIMVAAGQGQVEAGYRERLVAMTKRTEAINLCCDTLVDWRVNRCQKCGNTDVKNFYSPLSWKNKHGEMLLSNAVLMRYPGEVVGYLTKKVMQRPVDLRRTFDQHYNLFVDAQKFYPCLTEALRRVERV